MENQHAQPDVFHALREEQPIVPVDKGLRFVHLLVDLISFYIFAFIVGAVLGFVLIVTGLTDADSIAAWSSDDSLTTKLFNWILGVVLGTIYFTLWEGLTRGRTLGKIITGSVAIRTDGSRITWRDAFLRSISRFVPFEFFSGFSASGPWHDQWTNTTVVNRRAHTTMRASMFQS